MSTATITLTDTDHGVEVLATFEGGIDRASRAQQQAQTLLASLDAIAHHEGGAKMGDPLPPALARQQRIARTA